VTAAAVAVTTALGGSSGAGPDPADQQATRLVARSVLPSSTSRPGSPPSGASFSASDRATAAGNGVAGSATGAYLPGQPVQGISALIPDGEGPWYALSDNGYGARANSVDWQLVVNRVDPRFGGTDGPTVLDTTVLSDPAGHVPWAIACAPTSGDPLPPFDFNALPATPPTACGTDPDARLLTGFDFDTESLQIAADGTFWFGDEFGPWLLHTDRDGRLLEAPIGVPGVKAPQNATLDVLHGEQPNDGTSKGFEGMAISPDRTTLYPMFEGAVADDDPQTLRILEFDVDGHRFTDRVRKVRFEMPGGKVDLTALKLADGSPAYPGAVAPTGTGGESIGELTAVNDHQFLLIERDSGGDAPAAPRFKKVFLLDTKGAGARDGYVRKQLLVDLMAVPDPGKVGGDGDFFRFPFNTIESVFPVDASTLALVDDNNYPFSNGRSRASSADRTGPLKADDDEFILVRLGSPLALDARVLAPPAP
jgi:hypothetical protein